MMTRKRKLKIVYRQVDETPEAQSRIERFYNFIFDRAYQRWRDARDSKTADSSGIQKDRLS
jgi:hypothetical protein